LLDPSSGSFPPTLPIGFFLHHNPPCIFLSLGPVQGTFLQQFLFTHTVTHLTSSCPAYIYVHFLVTTYFSIEDGGRMVLQNGGIQPPHYMVKLLRKPQILLPPPWKPQIIH
jgi:hypothetical protein